MNIPKYIDETTVLKMTDNKNVFKDGLLWGANHVGLHATFLTDSRGNYVSLRCYNPQCVRDRCHLLKIDVNKQKIGYNGFTRLRTMRTREEALAYGLSFPNTYQDAPFHDENWQLVRVKGNKKVFLWTYERNGNVCINIKVNPEWRDFWRNTYESVLPGYHQNKEHWNTVILDGSVPTEEIKRMIAESYDLVITKKKLR